MILWTIQSEKAYEYLCQEGVLRAEKQCVVVEDGFKDAYEWMMGQMRSRIGEPPVNELYPIWAWYQWEGKRKRPDMRSHRHYSKVGEKVVLLTIDIPDDMVLLSDFDYWHCVLNMCPVDDLDEWTEDEMIDSWNKIFDYTCSFAFEDRDVLSTQATMWEIKKEWIVKVEFFSGYGKISNSSCRRDKTCKV